MQTRAPLGEVRAVHAPDGTRIAFTTAGSGPALVLTNGLTTTSFVWKYLRPHWLAKHTVVTWDLPGHGESEPARSAASQTVAAQPAIIARIMDELGLARATQIGFSVGCQVVLELARQFPERCDAVVTLFGSFEHALSSTALPVSGALFHRMLSDRHGAAFAAFVLSLAQLVRLPGGLAPARRLSILGAQTSDSDLRALIADMRRLHFPTIAALACSAEAHSAADLLASLQLPLLVIAGDRDRFAPPSAVGEPLHRAVPHSVFVRLPEATHTALLDQHVLIAREVDRFLAASGIVRSGERR
jgi:pimeloyl-ACP methyl ester carboxylesterase